MSVPHRALPPDAIRRLQIAAATPVTKADPMARSREIDAAYQWIRRQYPEYFRTDEESNHESEIE